MPATDAAAPSTVHLPTRDSRWIAGIVFLALVVGSGALAFYVQYPYRDSVHHNDEMYILLETGLVWTGKQGVFHWLLRPYSGHQFGGWKLLHSLELYFFGLDPVPWHVVVTLVHAFSALVVYLYLRRFLEGRLGPLLAALVWSGAAIGYWDNPLAWPGATCMAISSGLLLASLYFVDKLRSSASRVWDLLLFLTLSVSLFIWSVVWILTLAVPLQHVLMTGRRWRESARRLAWGWLLPFLLFGILQLNSIMPEAMAGARASGTPISSAIYRSAAQLGSTFSLLTVWDVRTDPSHQLHEKMLLAATFVSLTLLLNLKHWRWIVVILSFSVLYLFGVNISRPGLPLEVALTWGRYAYLPTLSWCLLIGMFLDGIARRLGKLLSFMLAAGLAVGLALFGIHQRQIAETTAHQYRIVTGPAHEQRLTNNEMLRELSSVAGRLGVTLRLPEVPMNVPPVDKVMFPLSAYLAIWFPEGLPNLVVISTDQWTDADRQQVFGILDSIGRPEARIWGQKLLELDQLDHQLRWLQEYARQRNVTIRVPDRLVAIADTRVKVSQFVAASYPDPVMSHFFQVPPAEWTAEDRQLAFEMLRQSTAPEAITWLEYLEENSNPVPQEE